MKYEVETTRRDAPIPLEATSRSVRRMIPALDRTCALAGVVLSDDIANLPMLPSTPVEGGSVSARAPRLGPAAPGTDSFSPEGARPVATPPRPPARVALESPSLLFLGVTYVDMRKKSPKNFREKISPVLACAGRFPRG